MRPKRLGVLYQLILSHLVVGVPPAILLGQFVMDINREALLHESQQLHLSVGAQLRYAISETIQAWVRRLDDVERVLDTTELPIGLRKSMVKAMVAGQQVPHIALHHPDGKFDSAFYAEDGARRFRNSIEPALLEEAKTRGFAVSNATISDGFPEVLIVVPWVRDGDTLGFLTTQLDLGGLNDLSAMLVDRYLGKSGELDVIDGGGIVLVSSEPDRVGHHFGARSCFTGFEGNPKKGWTEVETGVSSRFIDDRGAARLGAVVSAPELRWLVGSSRPESVAFASLAAVRLRALVLSLIAGIAAGILGLLLARRVSEPILAVTDALSHSIQDGHRKAIDVPAGGELERLVGSVNGLLRELTRLRLELRQKRQISIRLSRFLSPKTLSQALGGDHEAFGGEEEIVSLLYCDISKDEEAGQDVSPSKVVSSLGEFFHMAWELVTQHGGELDGHAGDAVLAVFRSSRGDDYTDRAVAAASALVQGAEQVAQRWRETAGVGFGASGAVATGVAKIQFDSEGAISVVGPLVEQVALLEADASVGQILIDSKTKETMGLAADRKPKEVGRSNDALPIFALTPLAAEPSGSEEAMGRARAGKT